jgi:osmotically-inducible protein OsmY
MFLYWSPTMVGDEQLQHDVLAELEWEPSINSSHIGVAAKNGVVLLTGNATSFAEKLTAERVTKRVIGVKALANDIEVKLPGLGQRDDLEIAAAALNALTWDVSVPEEQIKVTVRKGWVTLEGSVEWQFQRAAAEHDVRFLMGVLGVTNEITVQPKHVSKGDLKQKIHSAFQRSAYLDARQVGVDAKDGKVTLHGKVSSWVEREEAEKAAWKAPGVSAVENHLVVTP